MDRAGTDERAELIKKLSDTMDPDNALEFVDEVIAAECNSLRAEVARLREALTALADKVDATSECDHTRLSCEEIGCIGAEVRRARAAITPHEARDGQ